MNRVVGSVDGRKGALTMNLRDSNANPAVQSRRAFVRSAFAAAAAASGICAVVRSAPADPPAKQSRKIVVGAHPWVYAATQPNYDITPVLPGIFADMSYAGLDGIELMHTALRPADAVERIGELSRKHRLPIIGTSFGGTMCDRDKHNEVLEDAELVITRLAKLGGRTLGTSVGGAPKPKTEEQLDAQAELLKKIMALCATHGVELNLHNHTYEVENNEHDLRGTLKRIPDIKLGPDLNWLLRAAVDPVDFINRYGAKIVFLHVRDQKADGTWSEAVGEGAMDYPAIGRALRKVHFSGIAVIELAHERGFTLTRPLRDSLTMSREYMRKTLGF
jgi:sugar phosphate isomerase/epimerase